MNQYLMIVFLLCLSLGLVSADTVVKTHHLSQGDCPDGWVDGGSVDMGEIYYIVCTSVLHSHWSWIDDVLL